MVEVLIAGAGPAGATTALLLARAGIRVLLVDRATFPREKLCGDTLNPGALRILDRLGLRSAIDAQSLPLHGMLVTSGNGTRIHGHYRHPYIARAVTRRTLDMLLVQAAIDAGAQFQDHVRVLEPLVDQVDGQPRVRGAVLATKTRARLRIPALLTIAADGRRSPLALALGLSRHPTRWRRWAIGAYFDNVSDMTNLGEMHIRSNHYIGVAPTPNALTNTCLVLPTSPGATAGRHTIALRGFADPTHLLATTLTNDPLLRDRFAHARLATPPQVLGPLAVDTPTAGTHGLLLAGDAAGFVDPMTGDGLRFALRGAELAAETARNYLDAPELAWHEVLTQRRAREFATKQRMNRTLRALVSSPHAVRAAAHAAALAPIVLRRLIDYAGDLHTL